MGDTPTQGGPAPASPPRPRASPVTPYCGTPETTHARTHAPPADCEGDAAPRHKSPRHARPPTQHKGRHGAEAP